MRTTILKNLFIVGLLIPSLTACYDVHDGYRIDYSESPAEFNVTPTSLTFGAIGDTISFRIEATAESDIKSIIVNTSISGMEGSGFVVPSGVNDPLVDHTFGTIEKHTRSITLDYLYIVAQDSLDSKITFSLIDGDGKKSMQHSIQVVPAIIRYPNVDLYTNTAQKTDGFSTSDGVAYRVLSNYESVTEVNKTVQESLDIIFTVNGGSAIIGAPYDWTFSSNMKIRNKTKFKKLTDITDTDFEGLTNGSLANFVESAKVEKGATALWNVQVGDIIGFKTDYASKNSYKYGIIRINALHPASCAWYPGLSYVVGMDVVSQINKD